MLWKSKVRRRRASHPAAESSSEQGASEADIDSDSGYCSPKHSHSQTTATAAQSTECSNVKVCKFTLQYKLTLINNVLEQKTLIIVLNRGLNLSNHLGNLHYAIPLRLLYQCYLSYCEFTITCLREEKMVVKVLCPINVFLNIEGF